MQTFHDTRLIYTFENTDPLLTSSRSRKLTKSNKTESVGVLDGASVMTNVEGLSSQCGRFVVWAADPSAAIRLQGNFTVNGNKATADRPTVWEAA